MVSKKDAVGVTVKIVLLFIPVITILNTNKSYILEAYLNNSVIGYVDSRAETREVFSEVLEEINIDSKSPEINNERIRYTKITEGNVALSNKSEIKKNILEALTGKASAYALSLSGEKLGYMASNDTVNNILKLATDKHINELNIDRTDIISADIVCNVNLQEETTDISSIKTEEELADKIYNISKENTDLVQIKIKTKEIVEEIVSPKTVTSLDENLYIGESRIEEGEEGIKKVLKEVTYKNEKQENNNILEETIIKEPVNTIIHKGSKNPYKYGVAFLLHPTVGKTVTSGYGERWNSFHKGIDIASNIGDKVNAAIEGKVTYAQYNDGGYGNLIIIEHEGNMTTYYAHLSEIYAKLGDIVNTGDLIGAVGNTGFSTGPHLHFELRVNGLPVDPSNYILKQENKAS